MTTHFPRPGNAPVNPNFSSGPCSKRPGWSASIYADAFLGRSHRAKPGKLLLQQSIDLTAKLLGVPHDWRVGIVPASDTGAVEMAMWNLLGERGVDALAWESFGEGWVNDLKKQLKLTDLRIFKAPYGELPDLNEVDFNRDVILTWNGTTSGVRVPDASWISGDRQGLVIVDATSAVFAQEMDYSKMDVVTFSWQKVLGGEGAHGMLMLSPRAVQRLETYQPKWPLPKIFRLTKSGELIEGIFRGETINTPSMLCLADYLDALNWVQSIGGLSATIDRANKNAATVQHWVDKSTWVKNLARIPSTRSNTSVCLSIVDERCVKRGDAFVAKIAKSIVSLLESEGVAFDIGSYRDAPAGLRIWCGATVEAADLDLLTHWLDWAFETTLHDAIHSS